jgi:prolyl-tRNA synthetase
MSNQQTSNKSITKRDSDFASWYTDIVRVAKLASYSSVKGFIVFEPNGYAIWEKIQSILDSKFKATGHRNVSMPMLIPESLMEKEGELLDGFSPEAAWVTIGGEKQLKERLCIRPTSESIFSDYYSKKVSSHKDLPMKYNQWCSVIRWEKETRPFLRTREFLWQEGHTVHATKEEAEEEVQLMIGVYRDFIENTLAIPVITGIKTESEKFAGAVYTMTVEALMFNGVSLQSATSHYFGQKFAKAFDITFADKDSKKQYAYQTSWGISSRIIGGIIMVHSDDKGLVLPPAVAPYKVVIVPILNTDKICFVADNICDRLNGAGISSHIDNRDKSAGFRFAESEVSGIPIRIEIGEKDLSDNTFTIVRRDNGEKVQISQDCDIVKYVNDLLVSIHNNLFNQARRRMDELTYECHDLGEVREIMNSSSGFIKGMWCGDHDCELKMKEIKGTKSRCILDKGKSIDSKCIVCGKTAKHLVVWAVQY